MMTIPEIKEQELLLFECISGSRAYGLATPTSDTDIKGVFFMPKQLFFGLQRIDQINSESNDEMYYEIGRFIELLAKNNPNLMELLATPEECVLYRHPIFDRLKPELFLSKLSKAAFAGYAMTQIRKARGLKKKILNPIAKERKYPLDFCYVPYGQGSITILEFLDKKGLDPKHCGLAKLPKMHEMYSVYYNEEGIYKGLMQREHANDVSLSSISKGEEPIATMSFNKTGYSKYCKDYKEYWDWVEKRNDVRYENTISHGKNYDAKNMMHTFRLLDMALDIGEQGKVIVQRPNRDYLLSIKHGEFEYDYLLAEAEKKVARIEEVFEKSSLPDAPDMAVVERLLVEIREELYLAVK